MDVNEGDPGSNEGGPTSGLHNLHHHGENFFSTSSSSSSALSDVPLLDDSVFHQVVIFISFDFKEFRQRI